MGGGGSLFRQSTGGSGWTTTAINIPASERFVELQAAAGAAVVASPGALQFSAMAGADAVSRVSPSVGPSALALVEEVPEAAAAAAAPVAAVKQAPPVPAAGGKQVVGQEGQGDGTEALLEQLVSLRDEPQSPKRGPADLQWKKERKAALQLAVLIASELEHVGVCQSKTLPLSTMERAEAILSRIMKKGGSGAAAATTAARLFLQECRSVQKARGVAAACVPLFPMGTEDVAVFIKIWEGEVPPIKAKTERIAVAVRLLEEVGCRVKVSMDTLASAPVRRPAGSSGPGTTRVCPPPFSVYLRDGWAALSPTDPGGLSVIPSADYVRAGCVRMRGNFRGGNYEKCRFITREEKKALGIAALEGVSVICCYLDKCNRADVLFYIPEMPWSMEGPCSWQTDFAYAYGQVGFMYIDFEPIEIMGQPSGASICCPQRRLTIETLEGHGSMRYCDPKKAAKAEVEARAMACGFKDDHATFEAMGFSTAYPDRKIGPTCTKLARWSGPLGEKFANIIGDWADPKESGDARSKKKAKPSAGSRANYMVNATVKEQIEARTYFARMMQVAFKCYLAKLAQLDVPRDMNWNDTWEDLFPPDPPAELEPFYGVPSGYDIAGLSADLEIRIEFAPPMPKRQPKKARRQPSDF
jgi:hypothetical protein